MFIIRVTLMATRAVTKSIEASRNRLRFIDIDTGTLQV